MSRWTVDQIPDQTGKVAVITGANVGLGYESALVLAKKGAQVIIACRNQQKGQEASQQIKNLVPQAQVAVMALDLANLASVRQFAEAFAAQHAHLHLLMNNAGVMALPYSKTQDGFEMQLGTNHLGHFALTGLLLDTLLKTPNSRIITVSSALYSGAKQIDFDDLDGSKRYARWLAYSQSKLANILFARELQRRLATINSQTISVAVHPGLATTELQIKTGKKLETVVTKLLMPLFAQTAASGAQSQLYAATMPDVTGADFIGPRRGMFGLPAREALKPQALDEQAGKRLWEVSEKLTGVKYLALEMAQL